MSSPFVLEEKTRAYIRFMKFINKMEIEYSITINHILHLISHKITEYTGSDVICMYHPLNKDGNIIINWEFRPTSENGERLLSTSIDWETDALNEILSLNSKTIEFIDNSSTTVDRCSKAYYDFRKSVLKRDKVCQCCGSSDNLEVHHALSFNQYNSLGADTNNGIVLCKDCHTEYHSQFGYKKRNNPVTLAQFLRDYGLNPQSQLKVEVNDKDKELALSLVKRLQDDYAGDCPINVLLVELEDCTKADGEQIVKDLVNKGVCYQPTPGYLRVV